jgi:hypothetical protein
MTSTENWLVRVYRNRIGDPLRPGEAYGYWIVVAGIFLAFLGGVTLEAIEGLSLTASRFETLLLLGSVFLAIGPVLTLLGLVLRLPLKPRATVLASLGGTVAALSVFWVVVTVPPPLSLGAIVTPGAIYLGGVALILLAATVVPLTTGAYVKRDPTAVEHPYYQLQKTDSGWTWELCERDGTTVATSPETYATRGAARNALERMSTQAPMMGVEVTRRD